ncbi:MULTISPECIES: 2-hydroxyacid dehydrogenase [unclassified Streptomyces]|uniref:2-hydroxyacid dehydrogenase n=1 Tax=unclassified Streptomyces TaxID=2593676 RepID=UPI001313F51F|nr:MULTISPECIES: D-isomer specific 2-hydroxyacid dehydrogenase family protein [unclassified Streptomyces]
MNPTWWPGALDRCPDENPPLEDVTVLVTTHQELGATALSRMPALRLVIATSTATDYIDLDHCHRRGIAVHNTPGYTGPSVAEHAFALLLATARHICEADAAAHGRTAQAPPSAGFDLAGRTAGIVGLGDIGTRIARIAMGFGMRVLYVNPSARHLDGATPVSLGRMLADADVVFLSAPLTPSTRHLMNRDRFHAMKSGAILINVSADELVDPGALRSALLEGRLAGAALDLAGPTTPYAGLPRLTMTHRRGTYTYECLERRAAIWVATLERAVGELPEGGVQAEGCPSPPAPGRRAETCLDEHA